MNQLFSFYQSLLTKRQREYMSDYYEEDYTLQEIAENRTVSRQAVYDSIKRTEKILLNYEKEMGLVARSEKRWQAINQLYQHIHNHYPNDQHLIQMIDRLLDSES